MLNGTEEDAAVFMVSMGERSPMLSFYLRAKYECSINRIGEGTYSVFVRTGRGWRAGTQSFAEDESLWRFEETFAYDALYDGYEVTLNGVVSGNAKSLSVDEQDFPR